MIFAIIVSLLRLFLRRLSSPSGVSLLTDLRQFCGSVFVGSAFSISIVFLISSQVIFISLSLNGTLSTF